MNIQTWIKGLFITIQKNEKMKAKREGEVRTWLDRTNEPLHGRVIFLAHPGTYQVRRVADI